MKKFLRWSLITVCLVTFPARAQDDILLTVQDNNGNSQLTLSFPTDLSWAVPSAGFVGFGDNHVDSLWRGPTGSSFVENLTGFPTITDTTRNQSTTINTFQIIFTPDNQFGTIFSFNFPNPGINVNTGDTLTASPFTATTTVPIPFSYFAPGTLTTPPDVDFNAAFQITVVPIPEASQFFALALALPFLGFFYYRSWRPA